MTAHELVHQAIELAVERNPQLVIEPYYQMKAAAMILAERILELQPPPVTEMIYDAWGKAGKLISKS